MKIKTRCFRCNEWLWNELENFCEISGQTASMFIRSAIVEKLQRCGDYEKISINNLRNYQENNLRKIENIINKRREEKE